MRSANTVHQTIASNTHFQRGTGVLDDESLEALESRSKPRQMKHFVALLFFLLALILLFESTRPKNRIPACPWMVDQLVPVFEQYQPQKAPHRRTAEATSEPSFIQAVLRLERFGRER